MGSSCFWTSLQPHTHTRDSIIITSQEPALPLYLQSTYNFDVSKIGLVYIAAVVPSFICEHFETSLYPAYRFPCSVLTPCQTPSASPLSGWYADHHSTVASTLICLVCSLPFWCLIAFKGTIAYFIVMFACISTSHCTRWAALRADSMTHALLHRLLLRGRHFPYHGRARRRHAQHGWGRM